LISTVVRPADEVGMIEFHLWFDKLRRSTVIRQDTVTWCSAELTVPYRTRPRNCHFAHISDVSTHFVTSEVLGFSNCDPPLGAYSALSAKSRHTAEQLEKIVRTPSPSPSEVITT